MRTRVWERKKKGGLKWFGGVRLCGKGGAVNSRRRRWRMWKWFEDQNRWMFSLMINNDTKSGVSSPFR